MAERKVVGYRNPDGSANLSGYNLPVERVAAASGHIDALAKAAKRAGDLRRIDHIRAELFLGMTDGTYAGLDDTAILEHLRTTQKNEDGSAGQSSGADEGGGPDHGMGPGEGLKGEGETEGEGELRHDGEPDDDNGPDGGGGPEGGDGPDGGGAAEGECPAVEGSAWRSPVGAGMELRVRLSTLLGQDEYPGELAGWGPVHAELARDLATTMGRGQWRFAITDEHGQLLHCGITRARPSGTLARIAACRAIVELQVPAATLRALGEHSTELGAWSQVVTDLIRPLDRRSAGQDSDTYRRTPGAALRRYLEARDRSCVMIGCRAPARTTDKDHTRDHDHGGPTTDDNLGAACRHDHRLKGEGGWQLHQPQVGHFRWTTVIV